MKITKWIKPKQKYVCLHRAWGCGTAKGKFYIEMLKYFKWDAKIEDKPEHPSESKITYYLQDDALWVKEPLSEEKPVLVPSRSPARRRKKRLLKEKNNQIK